LAIGFANDISGSQSGSSVVSTASGAGGDFALLLSSLLVLFRAVYMARIFAYGENEGASPRFFLHRSIRHDTAKATETTKAEMDTVSAVSMRQKIAPDHSPIDAVITIARYSGW
jgi:hypothetical protein